MNQADLIAAAKAAAQTHGLVPELVCAVVEQESGWNTWLNRYEPAFEASPRYAPVILKEAHDFSATVEGKYGYETTWQTEIKNRCTSWGLMQVMGQVAREMGFKQPLPSICEVATGLELGCATLAAKLAHANGDIDMGLEAFNGGGDPDYAKKVCSHIPKYK